MINIPEDKILKTMQEVIDTFLIPKFIALGMNATGKWIESLEARVVDGRGEIWGIDYTYWLAKGRRPNKNQDPEALTKWAVWAGSTFIKDWAEAKGISAPPIAIAYKIAIDGTDYYPDGTDLLEVLNSPEVIQFVYDKTGEQVSNQVALEIQRDLQTIFAA